MKQKKKKLALEKFNIARLTINKHLIFGGGTTEPTDLCGTNRCDTETCSPQSNSSLECGLVGISDECQTQGLGCGSH
ncbi:hypothetical protein [uncultured Dokdonia sp.]|uniref:hypothetical protein n=1 Tax=uncultured Dokdonia sp. TaxID=575653 RepID=UPI002609616A|nr:hypothetical protein [uncultured Dokdonia sp.]